MKWPLIIFFVCYLLTSTALAQTNCSNLPKSFRSYDQALYEVKNAKFRIAEHINTSRSSFVTGASYYSCNGQTGFLIIGLKNRQYIYKDLPVKIWLMFKQASSFGIFYNQYIRNKYRLTIGV